MGVAAVGGQRVLHRGQHRAPGGLVEHHLGAAQDPGERHRVEEVGNHELSCGMDLLGEACAQVVEHPDLVALGHEPVDQV